MQMTDRLVVRADHDKLGTSRARVTSGATDVFPLRLPL